MRTVVAAFITLSLAAQTARADTVVDGFLAQGKFCSATAQATFRACGNETLDDYWIGVGICINESDGADRKECLADVRASRDEATALCAEQQQARFELCGSVGEARYDPEFERGTSTGTSAISPTPTRTFRSASATSGSSAAAPRRSK